jgi:hypothetical protein
MKIAYVFHILSEINRDVDLDACVHMSVYICTYVCFPHMCAHSPKIFENKCSEKCRT